MIINLDRNIEQAPIDESVRVILRQIVAALNALNDGLNEKRHDIVFVDQSKGIILRGTDEHYYRITLDTTGSVPVLAYEKLDKTLRR